jgi:hypothetical protein
VPVDREARGGDRGRPHRREIDDLARLFEALDVAEQHLDGSGEVMPECRRLGRLAVGVGDDQRRLFTLGRVDQRGQQMPRLAISASSAA